MITAWNSRRNVRGIEYHVRMISVSAEGLCRRHGRRWALRDVTFEVPQGQVVMVTGRNGAGKTTLLRVLSTALHADRGAVSVLGLDVKDYQDAVRQRISLLGHRTGLYEPLTALENLAVFARLSGGDSSRGALCTNFCGFGIPAL